MQALSKTGRLNKVLKRPILLNSEPGHKSLLSPLSFQIVIAPHTSHQCQALNTFSFHSIYFSGNYSQWQSRTATASFSTESTSLESKPTDDVKELYDKILESINVKRTMAPNAWLWSLIGNCKNQEDIMLLFNALENLRIFRLSNLRILENFNVNLCHEIAKACARVGALDFAKKTLWKHNVYGLSPTIGSAHHLLSYAKDHNDVTLMVKVLKLMKRNDLRLQPGTVDIVFSICQHSDNWKLISKLSKRFLKAGVKLRKTAFDVWMDFAVKRGDTDSFWKIEKLRSESCKQLTVVSEFSRAKALLLERKPEDAAAVILLLNQTLPEKMKSDFVVQLQKVAKEWPLDVVKHQPEENRKALAAALKSDIPAMVTGVLNMGVEVDVNLEDLKSKEIPC